MTKFNTDVTAPQAAFLEWALQRPDSRIIHHEGGWRSCAVGDYHREADGGRLTTTKRYGYRSPVGFYNWPSYAGHILPEKLNRALNSCSWEDGCLHTYGSLKRYIRDNYVENYHETPTPSHR